MAKLTVTNAFSINMLAKREARALDFIPLTMAEARGAVSYHNSDEIASAIGHADTARVVAHLLDVPERAEEWEAVAATRPNVKWNGEGELLVAQYSGPRLPEGATSLPEGAEIQFWLVRPAARFVGIKYTGRQVHDIHFFPTEEVAEEWRADMEPPTDEWDALYPERQTFPISLKTAICD